MSTEEKIRPHASRKAAAVKAAVVSSVALLALGSLSTVFAFASGSSSDASQKNVRNIKDEVNYDLAKGPLKGPGIPTVRLIVGIDPMTGKQKGFNIFAAAGANYVPALVEIDSAAGPVRHYEIVRLNYSRNLVGQFVMDSVDLNSNFAGQREWSQHILAAHAYTQGPEEAIRQVMPAGITADQDGIKDYAMQMGEVSAKVIIVDVSDFVYRHDPNSGETVLSGQKVQEISVSNPQAGKAAAPKTYTMDVKGVGWALMDNTEAVRAVNLVMGRTDKVAQEYVAGRFAEIKEVLSPIPSEPTACEYVEGTAFMPYYGVIAEVEEGFIKSDENTRPVMTAASWLIGNARRMHSMHQQQKQKPEAGKALMSELNAFSGVGRGFFNGPRP